MLEYVESMAWHMLAVIGHGRPSLVVLAIAVTPTCLAVTDGWPAVPSVPNLNGSNDRPGNDPCCHEGRKGIRAADPTLGQTVLDIKDIKGDALLTPASTTKRITSSVALLRFSPRHRFRTALLSAGLVRNAPATPQGQGLSIRRLERDQSDLPQVEAALTAGSPLQTVHRTVFNKPAPHWRNSSVVRPF